MNFSKSKNHHWYITKGYENFSSIKLIQVELYEDTVNSKLALKKDSFIGVFDSIDELNLAMIENGFENVDNLNFKNLKNTDRKFLHNNIFINNICIHIFSINSGVNEIEIQFVKDHYRGNTVYNPKYLAVKRLNEIYSQTKKAYLDFTKGISIDSQIELNKDKYLTVDLTQWNQEEKDLLFTDCLQGIYYYYENHTKRKSFDIGTYNSVVKAINNHKEIKIYKESVKWFNEKTKKKLKENNYSFPELNKTSNDYYYNSRETFNDTHYNDQLDMDQQSPEFWDSL